MTTKSNQEVELKFLIKKEKVDSLASFLDARGMPIERLQIENHYFDTAKKDLHQHKIGLRIRRWNDQSEQTIKMAGSQVGAMSHRPEYNVDYSGRIPQLNLFPKDIWPLTIDPSDLQTKLQEQFRIDFQRRRWIFDIGNSSIEVAIDQGKIFVTSSSSNSYEESICELEAELVSGSVEDLLQFSELLSQEFTLEIGTLSKAQRGFMLAAKANA